MSKPKSPAEQVGELIDTLGAPENMSVTEYIDFLEEIIDDCKSRRDACVNDELDHYEGD